MLGAVNPPISKPLFCSSNGINLKASVADFHPASRIFVRSSPRAQLLCHVKFFHTSFAKDERLSSAWKKGNRLLRKSNINGWPLRSQHARVIKAVATVETKCLVPSEVHHGYNSVLQFGLDSNPQMLQSSSDYSLEMDEREKLRRMRISKANKGNVPWNKGRKHSAETLQRIRERTRIAMQNPKVKMKLVNLGHAQSKETRIKIGVGVREGWQRRRERLMVQENCCFEWQNFIAEASRKGYAGESELEWDSYKKLDEQLKQEWLESVEQRKTMKPKGSKRAPKSAEQRRKISEAISAKWADPDYRNRVYTALAKYHGSPVGVEKPRRKRTVETSSVTKAVSKKKPVQPKGISKEATNTEKASHWKKRNNVPPYKDPMAVSKLEMLKKIRAERAEMEVKKKEATERAKLLIAEAERAARVLEVAALKSPLARASLLETRKLIAEASRSIQSIEGGGRPPSQDTSGIAPLDPWEPSDDPQTSRKAPNHHEARSMNGPHLPSSPSEDFGPSFGEPGSTWGHLPPSLQTNYLRGGLSNGDPSTESHGRINGFAGNNHLQPQKEEDENSAPASKGKKWVCGRLVEVDDV